MLSVWKLRHGQEAYYLEAVAEGVEDYYVGGEAPGRWIASSGATLGLAGEVSPDDLRAVLSGRDPSSGTRLGQPHKVPGFDLTFRAPKSVSVLFGLGEPDVARQVRDAHDHAVVAALDDGRVPIVSTLAREEGTDATLNVNADAAAAAYGARFDRRNGSTRRVDALTRRYEVPDWKPEHFTGTGLDAAAPIDGLGLRRLGPDQAPSPWTVMDYLQMVGEEDAAQEPVGA